MKICFFTIANTEFYSHIANTLAFTFKKHTKYHLNVFTKYPDLITFGNSYFIEDDLDASSSLQNNKMLKFKFFKKIKNLVEADYYLYIDPNNYIVKSFNYFEKIVDKDNMFGFLENGLASNTRETLNVTWHNKKLNILNSLFNEFSKTSILHYTISSGFFGFKKEFINEIIDKAFEIESFLKNKISSYSEEFILSILAGIYIKNRNIHLLSTNSMYYGEDHDNLFKDQIPKNKEWYYRNPFTNQISNINPAIINCYHNKYILFRFSKDILSSTIIVKENTDDKKDLNINFIIECGHPYNLPLIIKSIEEQMTSNIIYKIFVIFKHNRTNIDREIINFCSLKENTKIFFKQDNLPILNNFNEEGWIYQLEDNNVLYPNFIKEISNYIKENPEKECLIFHEQNGYKPKNIDDIKNEKLHKSMYLLNKKLIKNEEILNQNQNIFIENLHEQDKNKISFIEKDLCFFNKLRELE